MGMKKYAVVSMILLILTFFAATANADTDELKAYYIVEGNYNAENKTYTVDVYLDTEVYLAVGTFGMAFDEGVPVTWNDGSVKGENAGYMQIETNSFELLENGIFKENETYFKDNRYIVVQWGLTAADITNPIKLGSFTINNIDPNGWQETPFRLLNWNDTKFADDEIFTQKDETDGYGMSLNDEIWRDTTEDERANGAPAGYYQGNELDEDKWIDIGFRFTSNLDKKITIKGVVNAYNPKNDIKVLAKQSDSGVTFEGEITDKITYPTGKVTYKYEVKVDNSGDYTMTILKDVHLTYTESISIPYGVTDEYTLPKEVTLICGDINGDGYVKLPDRALLILFLNSQKAPTENVTKFNKSDLNGDGRVNLRDLNIFKLYFNKTY